MNEYDNLVQYEMELFKNRWTVFTALMSISFIVLGLGLKCYVDGKNSLILIITCGLAFIIYAIAFIHYFYFHGLAHELRQRGEELEETSHFEIFERRRKYRNKWKAKFKMHFHYIILGFSFFYLIALIVAICFLAF